MLFSKIEQKIEEKKEFDTIICFSSAEQMKVFRVIDY
jgi:hypothetical protein